MYDEKLELTMMIVLNFVSEEPWAIGREYNQLLLLEYSSGEKCILFSENLPETMVYRWNKNEEGWPFRIDWLFSMIKIQKPKLNLASEQPWGLGKESAPAGESLKPGVCFSSKVCITVWCSETEAYINVLAVLGHIHAYPFTPWRTMHGLETVWNYLFEQSSITPSTWSCPSHKKVE